MAKTATKTADTLTREELEFLDSAIIDALYELKEKSFSSADRTAIAFATKGWKSLRVFHRKALAVCPPTRDELTAVIERRLVRFTIK